MQLFASLLRQLVVTFGVLLFGTLAQNCSRSENYTARNQSEINSITEFCTEIAGELGLVDWSGPLTLPNVTRIRSVTVYSGDISSVDLPDLEYLGNDLILTNLPSLSRVSLPKLESIDGLFVDLVGDAPELQFPKLENVSSLHLRGNFSEQSFDALRNVEKELDICNAASCGFYSRMDAFTSMSLSFPVLERVGSLVVGGNVSQLSTPEITSFTCNDCDWAALHLKLYGASPIAVNFPKLSTMGGSFYIRGDIGSLSFPSLREYTHEFVVVPYEGLNITLPVEKGENFLFSGNVTDINLPNLKDFTRIYINESIDIDCDALWDELDETSGPLNETNVEKYFQCGEGVSCLGGIQVHVTLLSAFLVTVAGFLV
ncbi:uncharacterized protein BDV17DRAFT_113464 [Aspergillus undulatus]|uniref:uncharacterized protein n=1 Tax=Aspergillus undulatus TaxID=1810928 RepID=UPI003CCD726B